MDELTTFLFEMADISPCRILELTGDEGTAASLKEQGFDVVRPDEGTFEEVSFDAVISQDSAAAAEAAKLLKQGGTYLLSDVCLTDVKEHVLALEEAGFVVLHVEDATFLRSAAHPEEKHHYFLTVCEKL